jgi:hypothetical protein
MSAESASCLARLCGLTEDLVLELVHSLITHIQIGRRERRLYRNEMWIAVQRLFKTAGVRCLRRYATEASIC